MENLNIEKFSPKKAELISLVEKCKNLQINGIEDRAGFMAVDEYRKELKKARVEIQKTGKMLRAEALAFQKEVILKEKEMISLIEPTEKELEAKQQVIKDEMAKIARKAQLPQRQKALQEINANVDDDFILLMDDTRYLEFYNNKRAEFLEEKERKLEEEKEKERKKLEAEREAERQKLEAQKRELEEKERKLEEEKRIIAERKEAKAEAEKEKREALEKAEREKQAIIDKQKQERLEAEKLKKQAEEKERKEAERLAKAKAYQEFLAKHNYNEDDPNFFIKKSEKKIELFKKIGEYEI